ncbi:MAG: F0F1 ATP synthase subunit A [Phycisphaerales bacterium]
MDALTLAADNPLNHVVNHWFIRMDGWWIWSANQTNLVISALIVLIVGPWVAGKIATGAESDGHERYVTRNPFAHAIEVICVYLRDKVIEPLLHERTARFLPILLALFFFILINNMLGLIPLIDIQTLFAKDMVKAGQAPVGGTATQNLWVTGVLAAFAAVVINLAGIKELGVGGYIKHLTAEAPIFVWPIIIPIEILGTFIKPIALAIRLFANMTAGHTLLAVVFMLVNVALGGGLAIGLGVGVVSVLAGIAIWFLEIFVGFLQAFVFMFLTTVFISLLSHHGEEHDHEAEAKAVAQAGLA